MHYLGESSGAIRAGLFAQNEPDRVDRLVLCAFTYKGTGSPEISRQYQEHILGGIKWALGLEKGDAKPQTAPKD